MSFSKLGLSAPILKAIVEKAYDTPTPIQSQAIPVVLEGRDVMAAAQTGTGKTAGFILPILNRLEQGNLARSNQVRTLVLTPTRELAAQVEESARIYGRYLPLRSAVVFGGVKINPQMMKLRKGVDILVATPGRLLDLYNQNALHFKQLEVLVLDEADRMLDMGFIHDIRKILALLPRDRQTLMFSATFSAEVRKLAKGLVKDPVEISVSPRNTTVKTVKHWIHPVDKSKKPALLSHLVKENQWHQLLVFCRTKHGANRLCRYLEARDIDTAAIHGNKSQAARTRALKDFKNGTTQVLVATDIAARGLDISQLPCVVNFDLPNVPEDYVHRIGRTGRAGSRGQAVSFVSADEIKQLSDIEHVIKELLTRILVDGFEPEHNLPESSLEKRIRGPKRIRKPKPANREGQQRRRNTQARKSNKNKPGKRRSGSRSRAATGAGKDDKKSGHKPRRWNKNRKRSVS